MFVGEAPGRLGAARTGTPFSGDTAGRRFDLLLREAGMARETVFVTNAVLCLPLDDSNRNRRPTAREQRACTPWLAASLNLVRPALVVAMGGVALQALGRIAFHDLRLQDAGHRFVPWEGRTLAVAYHPAARSAVHRHWELQAEDWRWLGRLAASLAL